MYQIERLEKLLALIAKRKTVSIKDLEKELFISRSTLRRDLIKLENEQKIKRYFGQVALVKDNNVEFGYQIRNNDHTEAKKQIALNASDFIGENQALMIDSSSTCFQLYYYIKNIEHLIVITNGVHLAEQLSESDCVEVFVCSGKVKKISGSILGQSAIQYLDNFQTDIAFISCTGIDEHGVYMANEEQSYLKQRMIERTEKVILLCDSSKVDRQNYIKLCGFESIDVLITNEPIRADLTQIIEAADVEILY